MSDTSGGFLVGVDVGTNSARAGLFTREGKLMRHCSRQIVIWDENGCLEQSSDDIWSAVCFCVKDVCSSLEDHSLVLGIGFDATCSLVAVDDSGKPVTVSLSKDQQRNVILWQDHRAVKEAEEINESKHPVLNFVGGCISPEMQPPKLLWLKRNLQDDCWNKACHFFDLADFLTYKATSAEVRSLCCVVCKWTYIGHTPQPSSQDSAEVCHGWNDSFWRTIGLGELVSEGYARIGNDMQVPGLPVGCGLEAGAAKELGLPAGTPVATAIIDAHAGGIGTLGADLSKLSDVSDCPITSRLSIIAGTSSCHMASAEKALFVPGVWGPYFSAMLPNLYLSEGGQSSTGQLLDYVLQSHHSAYKQLIEQAERNNSSVHSEIESTLHHLAKKRSLSHFSLLTEDVHVLPDFVGNRSPLADPTVTGMISGLSMITSVEQLCILYLATVQSLAYGSRHIISTMTEHGHKLEVIFICGGLRRNRLYVEMHADISGLPVLLTVEEEAVLCGSAILAAAAAGIKVEEAMTRTSSVTQDRVISPCLDPALKRFHERKYQVFLSLYSDQKKYKAIMSASDRGAGESKLTRT